MATTSVDAWFSLSKGCLTKVGVCFLATSLSVAVVILVLFQGHRIETIGLNSRMTIF